LHDAGTLSATSSTLENYELVFNQDLNGDGYIDTPATVISVTNDVVLSLNPLKQAATIAAGATLELTNGDTSSVTFEASTGTLRLDDAPAFSGEIFNFAGNGTLSGSDQIDLRDINFSSVHDSYASGVLTVTDGTNTAELEFSGSYTVSSFTLTSDSSGGTIVYDPPEKTCDSVGEDSVNDRFVFAASLMQGNGTDTHRSIAPLLFDPSESATIAAALGISTREAWHFSVMMDDPAHTALTSHELSAIQQHHAFII